MLIILLKKLSIYQTTILRIFSGIAANLVGQGLTMAIQLLSLPIFLTYWDMKYYGQWLMLSAGPIYLSMIDGGVVAVAMNKITMLAAIQKHDEANRVFQSALLLTITTTVSVFLLALVIIWSIKIEILADFQNKLALCVLVLNALINLYTGLFDAIFRATDNYAKGIYLLDLARFLEWACAIAGLIFGGNILSVSLGFLFGRVLATLYLLIYVTKKYQQYKWRIKNAKFSELIPLIQPALSWLLFKLGDAINIQGMTILIGIISGPVALVIFNSYRTLSRALLQIISACCNTLWPEISKQYGKGNYLKVKMIYFYGTAMGIFFSIILSTAIFLVFNNLIDYWSKGNIPALDGYFSLFLLCTTISAFWYVGRIVLVATNQHQILAIIYTTLSLFSIGLAWLLSHFFSERGPILALIFSEITIACISTILVNKIIFKINKNM